MSVELCKVTLWLEATEPGKPLSFLDHHIQCGNSLLGATPSVLAGGLPDEAFKPIMGDDPEKCKEAKDQNKDERKQLALFHGSATASWDRLGALPAAMLEVDTMSDETTAALIRKEERYAELVHSNDYLNNRFVADAWCAAFVWKKTRDLPYPITNDVLRKIERNPHDCAPWMRAEIERLRDHYQFFHWHLAFPEVFIMPEEGAHVTNVQTGWGGGFDVILGNPPWERVKLQEKEWFAERRPDIAEAPNASARKRLIEKLSIENPQLYAEFGEAVRQAEGESHFLRASNRFPLTAVGDVNTFAIFAEHAYQAIGATGRSGMVLPTGIVTSDTTKLFFAELMEKTAFRRFVGFDNEEKKIFADIDNNLTFGAAIFGPNDETKPIFCFNIRRFEQLSEADRYFELSDADLTLYAPNTRTCPIFRCSRDSVLSRSIHQKFPLMVRETEPAANPWGVSFLRMFDMANDSGVFRTRDQLAAAGAVAQGNEYFCDGEQFVPLYEAKMIWHFEHRWASDFGRILNDSRPSRKYVGWYGVHYRDATDLANGRYWVARSLVGERIGSNADYLICYRSIVNRDLERTSVFAIVPAYAIGHKAPIVRLEQGDPRMQCCFVADRNSFISDFVTRNKQSGSDLTYFVLKQLPILPPETYVGPCAWAAGAGITLRDWLLPRVLELTYTAWDLEPFARDSGWFDPPFVWDEARRFQLRCELDAAFLHLYGLSRADAAYILDTFPIVRRKDEAAHGTYRTKDTILGFYDQLAEAKRSGVAFTSPLNPPPGELRACHPKRKVAILAFGSLRHDPGLIGKQVAFRIKTETPFPVEYGRLSTCAAADRLSFRTRKAPRWKPNC